jgi:hypothetical protein
MTKPPVDEPIFKTLEAAMAEYHRFGEVRSVRCSRGRGNGVGAWFETWFERGAGRGGVQGSFVPGQERRSA